MERVNKYRIIEFLICLLFFPLIMPFVFVDIVLKFLHRLFETITTALCDLRDNFAYFIFNKFNIKEE